MTFICKDRIIMYVFTTIDYTTTQCELFDARNGELISMELKGMASAFEYILSLKKLGYHEFAICG